jgi:hypothetical protein
MHLEFGMVKMTMDVEISSLSIVDGKKYDWDGKFQ